MKREEGKRFSKWLCACVLAVSMITGTTAGALVPVQNIEAHSGRTDSRGGHKDNKNVSGLGSYHYHCGGHPAHLHTDGKCPYSNAGETNTTTDKKSAASKNDTTVTYETKYDNVGFNAAYYATHYPDVVELCGTDAKALYDHFISSGVQEGRQASKDFNVLVYKQNNADLQEQYGDDNLAYYQHFVTVGATEKRIAIEK